MRPLTYEERRALSVRIIDGLEYETRKRHDGSRAGQVRLANALQITEASLRALMNPTIKTTPAIYVRVKLEEISKRWPGGAIFSGEWLGIAKGEGEQQELADVAGAAERAERRAGAA